VKSPFPETATFSRKVQRAGVDFRFLAKISTQQSLAATEIPEPPMLLLATVTTARIVAEVESTVEYTQVDAEMMIVNKLTGG
jgi:hypothetical protein